MAFYNDLMPVTKRRAYLLCISFGQMRTTLLWLDPGKCFKTLVRINPEVLKKIVTSFLFLYFEVH